MDRIEREEDLIELFAVEDIEVFYGQPCGKANTDFYLCGAQSLVEYCALNGIDSVIFHCSYAEPMRNYIPRIREELERQHQTAVTNNMVGVWKLPHIDETFYAPVLQKILEQLEQELGEKDEAEEADAEDEVTSIAVWAFHQGIRLYTVVRIGSEDGDDQRQRQRALHRKYRDMLTEGLSERRKEAYEESKRIEQEKQQEILNEMTRVIRQDGEVSSLKTVKARNDYADRICTRWQMERGHSWLTKKAVRAIVELEYANQNV